MTAEAPVALITGAAKRVGRAIAERLLEAGWDLAIHYRSAAEEAAALAEACRRAGRRGEIFQGDLGDARTAERLVPDVLQRFGRLDLLVNNASLFQQTPLQEMTCEDIDLHYAVNLRAPLLLAQKAAGSLAEQGGAIVNLSDAALTRPWPDHLPYMASKGALDTLTRGLARALAPRVRVVGVAPGVAAWPDDYDEETRARLTARIPLQRAGTPADIANLVHYLVTDGSYLNGVTIPVDGGRHIA